MNALDHLGNYAEGWANGDANMVLKLTRRRKKLT